MPVVSVLMACHRDTPFLRPAVASVLGQTFQDWELVLVDNGAGLDAGKLGEAGSDPRIKWIHLPANRGIPAAHNAAVAAARGDLVALLDHDDVMLPRRLERQVAALTSDPKLGLVSSLAETIDDEGRVVGREFALVSGADQVRYSAYSSPVVTPAYAGRREIFAALPYREPFTLTADFDFIARAAEQCALAAVPEVLTQYRRHVAQATREHAATIEQQRGLVRLCTARRRAGREEGALMQPSEPQSPAEASLQAAREAVREEFYPLTAYQARRAVALRRTPGVVAQAISLASQALINARREERLLAARMFFSGVVRALAVGSA